MEKREEVARKGKIEGKRVDGIEKWEEGGWRKRKAVRRKRRTAPSRRRTHKTGWEDVMEI
jgi:hypothetical protein